MPPNSEKRSIGPMGRMLRTSSQISDTAFSVGVAGAEAGSLIFPERAEAATMLAAMASGL